MRSESYDIAIIGGGIIGCALARELGKRFGSVLLMEKEATVGLHTSGRNSGVVHSGFNPTPGTLKAKLCVEGSKEIRELCKERQVPCEQVGTYVVATEESQIPVLHDLKRRGDVNGVPGIEILPIEDVREQESNVNGVAALFSPTGAIVDSNALTQTLAHDAKQSGVSVALGQEVVRIGEDTHAITLHTRSRHFSTQLMINCAGLYADRLAHMMGIARQYVVAPFRGEYFVVNRADDPIIRSMVYPVPNVLVPFLGVHLTKTVAGAVLIGPNAVPAFGREAYKRFAINFRDMTEMVCHRGFWNAFVRNRALVGIAWNEFQHSCSRTHFFREASRLVSGLCLQDLTLGRRVGIRPQLIHQDGRLVEDLVIETTPRSIHILNVVSPGMTSALAFGRWLSEGIDENLKWIGHASAA
ncbi:MAG TPA: L-2-hydroxyglutarate oxidase [Nitrospirales bacterium]|nr:L-2-hydroxyglutarate oxidase [Nitrospirales bacterium]HIN32988.1 L-2-hydroxyglutarate oxidase [Nitrospirales bacterium]